MLNKLIDDYLKENYYPFHMPGHKRSRLLDSKLGYKRDFTEIGGLDNLNDPKEVFIEMKRKIADIYKVKDAIISTNGSTSGILASIRTLTKNNKNILIQRSSHKAVYHACLINKLEVDYLDIVSNDIGAITDISYLDLERKLNSNNYSALVITSPSYEGYILNIERIYDLCRANNTKLILDMAHGSHLFLTDEYKNSFDIAITSFHKNLPALTPAAAVLVNDESIINDLRFSMTIFQTSSPSYLVLQSIDYILENLDEVEILNEKLSRNLDDLYGLNLKNLKLVNSKNKDRSKILISTKDTNINGKVLGKLLKKEKIEIEMAYPSYALLIASTYDTDEGFKLLKKALLKIDKNIKQEIKSYKFSYIRPKKIFEIYQAMDKESKFIDISKAAGKIAGGFTHAYPPGIPILAPGELIDENILENINNFLENDINVNLNGNSISVLIDKREENC
ncbi:aminotransferase class I/II-fold pyridoxal phosphate-dependent enzyme [uncultured Anaerococcus sp.]|uniref:aminotransferase class I/II-fold pyridoxal phosphate-dependent enzyme n=1 Tax=uncultured Anaerococcus sp. TaxID=293428 RepID=UPI00288B3806|nr:aminotransferase class I/II-fold pyridoxal phosphate-dependent enzyme [uncultured Anaerococcus sp.]